MARCRSMAASLLLLIFFIPSSSSSRAVRDLNYNKEVKQKVEVTVYYEAMCPYCSYFIAHDLTRIFTQGLLPIVHLRLVPWGNAGLGLSGTFQCQHGPRECLLNTVEACAISVYPETEKHFFLIQCIESLMYEQRETEWQTCFHEASLDSRPIFDCYNTGHGHQIELQYASETNRLNPPHAFVPWVLVNNQPLKEDYHNFISYVCKAYRRSTIPQLCHSKLSEEDDRTTIINTNSTNSSKVCYPGSFKMESTPPLPLNLSLHHLQIP